jgi:hypothetical protein
VIYVTQARPPTATSKTARETVDRLLEVEEPERSRRVERDE